METKSVIDQYIVPRLQLTYIRSSVTNWTAQHDIVQYPAVYLLKESIGISYSRYYSYSRGRL